MARPALRLLRLHGVTTLAQLQLEEDLYRTKHALSHCIVGVRSPVTSVVLGVSGNAVELLYVRQCRDRGVEILKRFSGGGTVVTDEVSYQRNAFVLLHELLTVFMF